MSWTLTYSHSSKAKLTARFVMEHGQEGLGLDEASAIWDRALASSGDDDDDDDPGTSGKARAAEEDKARQEQREGERRRIAQVAQARANPSAAPLGGRHVLTYELRQ